MIIVAESQARDVARRINAHLVRISDVVAGRSEEDAIDRVADIFQCYDQSGRVMVVENTAIKHAELTYRAQMIQFIAARHGAVHWDGNSHVVMDRHVARLNAIDARGIGDPDPDVVIVTDGPKRYNWRGLPMSARNIPNAYFWKAVFGMKKVYVMDQNLIEMKTLLAANMGLRFVAVGLAPSKWLRTNKIPHTMIDHPDAVLKSKKKEIAKWAERLRRACTEK